MTKYAAWIGLVLVAAMSLNTSCARFQRGRGGAPAPGEFGDVVGVPGGLVHDVGMGEDRLEGTEARGEFEVVFFDYDSSLIKISEQRKIEQVADAMRRDARMQIVVEGHCDERGSAEYNLALGERRALSIRAFLVGLGEDASRIQTRSFGEEKPVALGSNEDAWRQNRRGEFVVLR